MDEHSNKPEPGSLPSDSSDSNEPSRQTHDGAKRSELPVAPFIPRSRAGAPRPSKARSGAAFTFAVYAAAAACLLGFGWAAGSHLFGAAGPFGARAPARQSAESLERAEILRSTRAISEDFRSLKADVEAIRAALAQSQTAKEQRIQDQRALEKGLDGLKAKLDAAKAETGAAIADLSGKIDRLQRDPAKLNDVVERVERIERQAATPLVTGSIAPPASPAKAAAAAPSPEPAPAKPQPAPEAKKPPLITKWVVRDVYNGLALVENARGSLEVAVGETIPGAGAVKAIQRRGQGWIVVTDRGYIDFAHDNPMP